MWCSWPLDPILETTEKYKIAQELMFRSVCGMVEPLYPIPETTEEYKIAQELLNNENDTPDFSLSQGYT